MANTHFISGHLTKAAIQKALDRVTSRSTSEGYSIAIIPEDRYRETFDLIKNHYIPDEPLSNAFEFEWKEEYEQILVGVLRENLSLMMVSNDNRLMGVRISGPMKTTDPEFVIQNQDSPIGHIMQFVSHKYTNSDFFARHQVEEAMHFLMLSVHKDFRRRGVAGKLVQASVSLSAELGFKFIKAEATSNYTQKIFEKEGFTVLCEMPYDEYFYKGQPLRNKTGPHTTTKILVKSL